MTRFKPLPALALSIGVGACTAIQPDPPPRNDVAVRLDRGLAALDAGHYRESFDDLSWVYSHCSGREAGAQALAGLAAIELDPRNDLARPALGVELLGELLGSTMPPRWLRPVIEVAYLESLALGAPVEADMSAVAPRPGHDSGPSAGGLFAGSAQEPTLLRDQTRDPAYGCGAEVDGGGETTRPLPRLQGPTMWSLLVEAESDRDSLAVRADSLQAQLGRATEQLQATREELERIRKTLKP
jgi:hypothetical protein